MNQMKRRITIVVGIGGLYLLNRFCLIPATNGVLNDLLSWYGADILAGALILCVLQTALLAAGRTVLRNYGWVTLFLLACGLFWEVITPIYLPGAVGDLWDLLAYWLGGSLHWILENKWIGKREP